MGGLNQLGGSPLLTYTPWSITGDNVVTTDGIVGSGYTGGSNLLENHLKPDQTFTTASIVGSPVFLMGAFSQNYQDTASQGRIYGASGPAGDLRNYTVFGSYSGADTDGAYIAGVSSYGTGRITYSLPKIFRDRNRPWLGGTWLHGSGSTCVNLINSRYDSGITPGSNVVHSNFALGNGATSDGTGRIHFAALAFCDPNAAGGKSSWQRLFALLNSTLWSHNRSNGHLRVQLGGQSNASSELALYLNRDELCDNGERCTEVFQANTGGVPITQWVGSGIPTRTVTYQSEFWKGDGTGMLEQGRPLNGIGRWGEWVVWFQGESDSETDSLVGAYQERLEALIKFWRADTGNPNLKVMIVKIGYHRDYRTQAAVGNFTMSGCVGGSTDLNGVWTIQPLVNETDPYVWTKSGYSLHSTASGWQIVDSMNVVHFYSPESVSHPQLVETWTSGVGAGIPSVSSSRTGRIEAIRSIQQRVADADPQATTIDARQFSYKVNDTAHMTPEGRQSMASAMAVIFNEPWGQTEAQKHLRITKIMHDPASITTDETQALPFATDSYFKYMELQNVGQSDLDLSGCRFVEGLDFTFPGGSMLQPGARCIVAANLSAFDLRYGSGKVRYAHPSGLTQFIGEKIRLEDAGGRMILDFTFGASWYPNTTKQNALVFEDMSAEIETWGSRLSWRTSSTPTGSPGVADPLPPVATISTIDTGGLEGSGVPGRSYVLQRSSNLELWEALDTVVAEPDGTVSVPVPPNVSGRTFYRLQSK